ncbi:MAG: hypothetical protein LBK42_05795 [Propionibacteriaceae bacterium]|nr:hypothetical protein [Propionibacteriaceae bacterium]
MSLFDWLRGAPTVVAAEVPAVLPPAPTPTDITAALDQIDRQVAGDATLSGAVRARVRRVASRLRDIVPRMDNSGLATLDQYSLIATATSYLPEALGGYVRLPRDWANSRPVMGAKTPLLILIDQLDLLAVTVDRMYDAVLQRDAAALVAHGRFLRDKFAPGTPETAPSELAPVPAARAKAANPLDLDGP